MHEAVVVDDVRLVDVVADRHVWGDSFDGSGNDPFALQDRVVEGVQCGVVAKILDAELDRLSNRDPNDLAVRDLAIQALRHILAGNVPSARKAITILNRAIELEPACALPVALLAWGHAQLGAYYGTASPAATRDMAMQLAGRAGMLDECDPLVTLACSATAALSLQSHEADALAARALAMDPTCSWAWERHGNARLRGGDPDRAIAYFARALKLRGASLPRGNRFVGIASAHAAAGRLEDAVLWQRKALAENPAGTWMYILDSCYALKAGNWSRVLEGVECMRRAQPELSVSLIMVTYPPADPTWLGALARAGMPLT
jgi:adenylate cyclase